MSSYKHSDMSKLAKLVFTFKNLIEQFDTKTSEDLLLIAAALEMNAGELRQQAANLEREINLSVPPLDPAG